MADLSFEDRIAAMVDQALIARDNLAEAERAFKRAQQTYADLIERDLPAILAEAGLASVATTNGLTITVKDDVYAYISEARQADAFKWLRESGNGGMIKLELTVRYDDKQAADIQRLASAMKVDGLLPEIKESVHASTLKAFIREGMQEGIDIPLETFGVFVKKVARIA
jgi:hypothetical protein